MVRRKKTKRNPGTSPPLGRLVNQPPEIEEEVQPEQQLIRRNSRKNNAESSMGSIRGVKGKSNQPLSGDIITPPLRGGVHLGASKRETKYVVNQDDVNRDNVDNVIQQVYEEIMEQTGDPVHEEEIVEETGAQEQNQREGKQVVEEEGGNEDGDDDDGEEDEDEKDDDEEQEEVAEEVVQKKPKPPCARYAYIPENALCLPPKNPTYGTPRDGGLKLIGYKNSWAAKIFATKDHNKVVRVLKRQKHKKWSIEHECDEFKNAVYDCVLWKEIEQAHQKFDAVTVTVFSERAYLETDTFLLPFGEMAITPNDCYRITGLPIIGTSVRAGYDPNMVFGALEKLVEKCLGWDSTKAQCEFRKYAKKPKRGDEINPFNDDRTTKKMLKKIKMNTLFDEFSETRAKVVGGKLVMTEENLKNHVTAYLLYQLGTIFFLDTSGATVNAHYLQLLDPLGEVNNYCWGISVLSFVQAELRKASRLKSFYFGGLYTLVQVWVYDHFPELKLSHSHDPWPYGKPIAGKYEFLNSQDKKKEEKVLRLREKLYDLTLEDMVFRPYAYDENKYDMDVEIIDFSPVAAYNGPLFHPGGYTMYNPRIVLRQYSFIQTIPDEDKFNFKVMKQGTKNTEQNFVSKYDPTPSVDHWNNMYEYVVPVEDLPGVTD